MAFRFKYAHYASSASRSSVNLAKRPDNPSMSSLALKIRIMES